MEFQARAFNLCICPFKQHRGFDIGRGCPELGLGSVIVVQLEGWSGLEIWDSQLSTSQIDA